MHVLIIVNLCLYKCPWLVGNFWLPRKQLHLSTSYLLVVSPRFPCDVCSLIGKVPDLPEADALLNYIPTASLFMDIPAMEWISCPGVHIALGPLITVQSGYCKRVQSFSLCFVLINLHISRLYYAESFIFYTVSMLPDSKCFQLMILGKSTSYISGRRLPHTVLMWSFGYMTVPILIR